jgi:hypothetical protein
VVVRLDIAGASVVAVGGMLMGFLDWWWRIEAVAMDEFCTLADVGIEGVVFEYAVEVGVGGWVMRLPEWRLLPPILLVKDLDGVLKLHKSCPFVDNVLHFGFGMLSCCLPACDGFLFWMEPLNFLLNLG